MRVCYFGAYRHNYARNRILIEGLRRNGVEVSECHEALWQGEQDGIPDRVQAVAHGWRNLPFLWRVLRTYLRLLGKYLRMAKDYDIMVVGYPGHFDVPLARLLTWLRRRPLVWDVCMSIYLIACERKLHEQSRWGVRLLRGIERLSCRLPDRLLIDTEDYAQWFGRTHGVARQRFRLVPIGADSDRFQALAAPQLAATSAATPRQRQFRVLYYGSYIPNHAVGVIIEAAYLLRQQPEICFEMIGSGPDQPPAQAQAQSYGLSNVTFIHWMEQTELLRHIAQADLCLGAFGDTPQSLLTIHNKVLECMAMARPVLHGDGPAVRRAFRHGEEIYLCERLSGAAIATAIGTLAADPALCVRLAQNGYACFQERYTIAQLGQTMKNHLDEVLHSR